MEVLRVRHYSELFGQKHFDDSSQYGLKGTVLGHEFVDSEGAGAHGYSGDDRLKRTIVLNKVLKRRPQSARPTVRNGNPSGNLENKNLAGFRSACFLICLGPSVGEDCGSPLHHLLIAIH